MSSRQVYRWSLEESFDYRNKLEVHQHVDGIDTYVIKKKKNLTRIELKEGQNRAIGYCNLLNLIEIEASKGDRKKISNKVGKR